jgi:hypothetical protein
MRTRFCRSSKGREANQSSAASSKRRSSFSFSGRSGKTGAFVLWPVSILGLACMVLHGLCTPKLVSSGVAARTYWWSLRCGQRVRGAEARRECLALNHTSKQHFRSHTTILHHTTHNTGVRVGVARKDVAFRRDG